MWLLHRLRVHLGPLPRDDLELPLEHGHPLRKVREVEAERLVLLHVPPGPEPELDSPSGDVVDGERVFRQHRRMPERDRRDERSEPDALGSGRQSGERRPGIQRAPLLSAESGQVVVGAEEPLEAALLAGGGKGEPVLPLDAFLSLDHQADAH